MTLDLAALDIVSVNIIGSIECNPEQEAALTARIRTYRKGWPRTPLMKVGLDTYEGFERHVEFSLRRLSRRSGVMQVRLQAHPLEDRDLSPRSRKKQIAEFSQISDLMDFIEGMDAETHCHAHVNWEFEPGSYETIIRLPLFETGKSKLPFEHISGVRFIRRSEDGEISIIIDRARSGDLMSTVQIPLSRELSLKLIDDVTIMATQIIDDFVFDVPTTIEEEAG